MSTISITFTNPRGSGAWLVTWPHVPRVGDYVTPEFIDPMDRDDPHSGERKPDQRARGAVTRVTWEAWADGTVSVHVVLGTER